MMGRRGPTIRLRFTRWTMNTMVGRRKPGRAGPSPSRRKASNWLF